MPPRAYPQPAYENPAYQSGPPPNIPFPTQAPVIAPPNTYGHQAAATQSPFNMTPLGESLPQVPAQYPMQTQPVPPPSGGSYAQGYPVDPNRQHSSPPLNTSQQNMNNDPANRGRQGSRIHPSQMPSVTGVDNKTIYKYATTNDGNTPPPATCQWITNDVGNCSPRFMRMTCYSLPTSKDIMQSSGIPFAASVQPLAQLQPGEVQLSTVDFEDGPLRCGRCGTYINPFVQWVKSGKAYCCKICSFVNDVPPEYFCPLDGMGRRTDTLLRPELSKGSVEFVAKGSSITRPLSPPLILFALDVSYNALVSGQLHAAINSISTILNSDAMAPNVRVGFITFDTTIQFYNLNRSHQQAHMLVVPDIHDVFLPLAPEVAFVQYKDSKDIIDGLLQKLPGMFQNTKITEAAFAAAVQAGLQALKPVGGRMLVFQSCIPTVGPGKLQKRNDVKLLNTDKEKALYQPQDPYYTQLAQQCVEASVSVDIFLFPTNYLDVSTMSTLSSSTGGQVYMYHKFNYAKDLTRFYQDLTRNLTREYGYDGVMRVRTSEGFTAVNFIGNFTVINGDELRFAGIDSDKSVLVEFQYDGKIPEKSEPFIQAALLYTNSNGERRIRVHNITLQCSNSMNNIYRGADVDAVLSYLCKTSLHQATSTSMRQIRDTLVEKTVLPLAMYRKHCCSTSQLGQLILPEALKLLPVMVLAFIKSVPIKPNENNIDMRSFYLTLFRGILNPTLNSVLVYPRLYALHNMPPECGGVDEQGYTLMPPLLPLKAESLSRDGAYLLEDGLHMYVYLGREVQPAFMNNVFGVHANVDQIDTKELSVGTFDNEESIKVNNLLNTIRQQRAFFPSLHIVKSRPGQQPADEDEYNFYQLLFEDKINDSPNHVDFLVHIHKAIQAKINE